MANLLELLGMGATAATGMKAAQLEGQAIGDQKRQADLLAQIKQEQEAGDRAMRQQMHGAQMRNIDDQIRERNEVKPITPLKPSRQIVDGQIVDIDAGTAAPIRGFTPTPKVDTSANRNIDPLSQEGIAAAAERARQLAQIAPPKAALPTQGERKAAAFYASGKQGYDTLEALLAGDDPSTPIRETGKGKEVPGFLAQQAAKIGFGTGNVMTNQQVRQMRQSALMLSDAWLRYTSGAAVPEQEVERFAESFIPRAGDDAGTLAQKAQARKVIIEALREGAGRALDKSLVGNEEDEIVTSTGKTFRVVNP